MSNGKKGLGLKEIAYYQSDTSFVRMVGRSLEGAIIERSCDTIDLSVLEGLSLEGIGWELSKKIK